jgi:hypothetical protein
MSILQELLGEDRHTIGHKPQFIPKNNSAHNATAKYTFFVEAIVIAAWEI